MDSIRLVSWGNGSMRNGQKYKAPYCNAISDIKSSNTSI